MQLTDEEKENLQEKIDQEFAARKDRNHTKRVIKKWVIVCGLTLLCAIIVLASTKSKILWTLLDIISGITSWM